MHKHKTNHIDHFHIEQELEQIKRESEGGILIKAYELLSCAILMNCLIILHVIHHATELS